MKPSRQEFNASDWVQIGIVGKPYGVRGAFYVSGRDEPLYDEFENVIIADKPSAQSIISVIQQKVHKDRTVLIVENIDRNQIGSIVGTPIWVLKNEIEINEDDEYLWEELIDRRILTLENKEIGIITEVANYGASDIIEIRNQQQIISLPFIDAFFDMNFTREQDFIRLIVSEENLHDLWQPLPTKK